MLRLVCSRQPARRLVAALTGILAVAALISMPAPAEAQDSDAPPGAPDTWLPDEAWVGEHWIPYDERDLYRVLKIDQAGLAGWLSGERHNLAGLARARGMTPRAAVDAIMSPQHVRLPAGRYRLLRSRAMRTFTQTHLSVHLFFHPLHDDSFERVLPDVLGVGYGEMGRLRAAGLSLYDIAARHGNGRRRVNELTMRALRAGMARGKRLGMVSPLEARTYLAYQRSAVAGVMEYVPSGAVAASATGAPRGSLPLLCTL